MMAVFILFYVFIVPLRLAFDSTSYTDFVQAAGGWFIMDLVCDILFIGDIFLNFRTTFRKLGKGGIVTDSRKIALHYLKFWFWIDIVASFPLSVLFLYIGAGNKSLGKANKMLRVLRFAKLSKLFRVLKMGRIAKSFGHLGINPGLMRLARLCMALVSMWHFIACAYWVVAQYEGFCTWYEDDHDDSAFLEWGNGARRPPPHPLHPLVPSTCLPARPLCKTVGQPSPSAQCVNTRGRR